MTTITEIEQAMLRGQVTPYKAADYRVSLSANYSKNYGEMEEILLRRPSVWNQLRKDQKSDKATDRVYEGTADGLRLMQLELQCKKIEKMISALSTLIRVAEKD